MIRLLCFAAVLLAPALTEAATWSRRAPVTISDPGEELTNHQVEVNVTWDADMEADFGDVRFGNASGGTLYDFFLQSYTSSTSAVFWVEIPTVDNGGTTIYMFYGASNRVFTTSDGSATFPTLFDDFDGRSVASITDANAFDGTAVFVGPGANDTSIREPSNILYDATDTGAEYKTMWSSGKKVYAAYSSDGRYWTRYNAGAFVIDGAEDPYVLKDGSTYYCYTEEDPPADITRDILLWTSTDFVTWTEHASSPVLQPGPAVAWDDTSLSSPCAWKEGSTWYMLYEGSDDNHLTANIGLATSSDGISWTKEATNPVIDNTGGETTDNWANLVGGPATIEKVGSTYYLLYIGKGNGDSSTNFQTGIATSTDLTTWTDSDWNPIIDQTGYSPRNAAWYPDSSNRVFIWETDRSGMLGGWLVSTDDTLDSEWTATEKGTASIKRSNGHVLLRPERGTNNSASILSTTTVTNGIVVEMRSRSSSGNYRSLCIGAGAVVAYDGGSTNWGLTTLASGYWIDTDGTNAKIREQPASGGNTTLATTSSGVPDGVSFEVISLSYDASGGLDFLLDGTSLTTASDTTFLSNAKAILVSHGTNSATDGGNSVVDWVRVRKHASTQPTGSVGSEATGTWSLSG